MLVVHLQPPLAISPPAALGLTGPLETTMANLMGWMLQTCKHLQTKMLNPVSCTDACGHRAPRGRSLWRSRHGSFAGCAPDLRGGRTACVRREHYSPTPSWGLGRSFMMRIAPGALHPVPSVFPNPMAPAEITRHGPHLPYHPPCLMCCHWQAQHPPPTIGGGEHGAIPLLVAGCCFAKSTGDGVAQVP